ncbi:MAG TPA: TniQ family protein [Azospirillaceae bacterium]|nr:TniQ family protein [Azospirillaceae bacterium]
MVQAELWPWRPAVLPDETFSSWFARVAAGNGLSPTDFFRAALPGAYRYTRDLDRYVEPGLIANLAERTGIGPDILRQATFDHWAGLIFESDDGRNKLYWLATAGTEDGQRSFGQQICPDCLNETSEPYLRRSWRLGFVTACPHHRRLLVDRCPQCAEPIQVLRSGVDHGLRCWKCSYNLAKTPQDEDVPDLDIGQQQRLVDIAQAGWIEFGAYGPVYSFAYFRILMLVFRLLATGRHAVPLRAWCERQFGEPGRTLAVPRIRQIEMLSPRCRHELLRMATYLTEDWPHRFVAACRASGVSSRHLLKSGRTYPYPFAWWHAVEWNLKGRAVGPNEIHAGIAYLKARKSPTTYRALVELFGVKITANQSLAEPAAADHAPWGKGRYWKLDGVSSEVRAAARLAAHREGESLGSWVDKVLRQVLEGSGGRIAGS